MIRVAAVLLLAAGLVGPGQAAVTVSAAASLTDALEAIAELYAGAGGGPVRFNFAGSNVLARQIAGGAPVDVFISADAAQMDVAERAGAVQPGTRFDLLSNRLAIVTRPEMAASVPDARGLTSVRVRRVAVGDPAAVPAGVYARQYLERAGLWDALQPRLVPVSNVRAALSAVENGSVDAAVVYETDAIVSSQVVLAAVLTSEHAPRIVYPAALLRAGANRAGGERFLAFLRSEVASRAFERYRFTPLARAPR